LKNLGGGCRVIAIVALTSHPKADEYLVELSKAVENVMLETT